MVTYLANQAPVEIYDAWDSLEAQQRAMYLVNAARTLDGLVEWIGVTYDSNQKMKWPRRDAYVDGHLLDSTTVPQKVVDAQCEMAIWLMQSSGAVSVQQSDAYSAISVGPIRIHYNQQMASSPDQYYPDVVAILLADYGQINQPNLPGARSLKIARLQRA
jgi:hypothetical protein